MLLLIAVAFLLKRYGTQAIPLPAPSPVSASFDPPIFARDNPSDGCHSRTVLEILWSCLATTFACTWVSVHPNVPFEGEGKWTLLRRRIFLMFFSILAPEFMIMWAFKQWRGAVMIREAINTARPESGWTTTHGHFLQMGGFKLQSDDDREGYVLHFNEFEHCLRSGRIRFPTITEDEINDKSKGDALSKGIALLQLTWFIVQIITRAVQGLAITELELTTAALAGLNSIMYVFWWSKPRDVRFPVVIRTKGVEELLAEKAEDAKWSFSDEEFDIREHLWMSVTTTIGLLFGEIAKTFSSLPINVNNALSSFFKYLKAVPHSISRSFSQMRRYFAQIGEAGTDERQKCNMRKGLNDRRVNSNEGQEHINSEISKDAQTTSPAPNRNHARKKSIVPTLIDGVKSTLGFALLPFYTLVYLVDLMLFIPIKVIVDSDPSTGTLSFFTTYDTSAKLETFTKIFYSEDADTKPLLSTSSIAGALFGAVHCLAWHFIFPSHAEQILWRTASLGIVVSCAVTFQTVIFVHFLPDDPNRFWKNILEVLGIIHTIMCGLACFIYPVSRITLLVLAITSLRSLPHSALDTVDWVDFVPHI